MFWEDDADELIEHLTAAEILDDHPVHRLVVHGWGERADDAIQISLARKGLLSRGGLA